jgi:hypothetical protein
MVIWSDRNAVLRANRNQDIRLGAAKHTGRPSDCHAAMGLSGFPGLRADRIAGLTLVRDMDRQTVLPLHRLAGMRLPWKAVVPEGRCPGIPQPPRRHCLLIEATATRFSGVTGIWQNGCSVKPANRQTVIPYGGVSAKPESWYTVGRRIAYGPTAVRSDRQATGRFAALSGTQSDRRTGFRSACAQGR